jgi:uncharacterized protein (DUF433 family)
VNVVDLIISTPGIPGGAPRIAGTRIAAATIAALIERGMPHWKILQLYSELTDVQLLAVREWMRDKPPEPEPEPEKHACCPEVERWRELVADACPMGWAAAGDIESAYEWEQRASDLLCGAPEPEPVDNGHRTCALYFVMWSLLAEHLGDNDAKEVAARYAALLATCKAYNIEIDWPHGRHDARQMYGGGRD